MTNDERTRRSLSGCHVTVGDVARVCGGRSVVWCHG
jgi:hypothetical protein